MVDINPTHVASPFALNGKALLGAGR